MEDKTTIQDANLELKPILSYVEEIHKQKESISVVREFLEGRITIEKDLETKEVLKVIYKRLAEPEEKLGKIESEIFSDVETVCVKYSSSIINIFVEKLNAEIKNLYKEKEVKNYENS